MIRATQRQLLRLRWLTALALAVLLTGQSLALDHIHAATDEPATCYACGLHDQAPPTPAAATAPFVPAIRVIVESGSTRRQQAAVPAAYSSRAPPRH